MTSEESWEVVEIVGTEEEASLIAGFLEAEGIVARVESLLFDQQPTTIGNLSEVRVHVEAANAERAKALLAQREVATPALAEGVLGVAESTETKN